MALNLSRDPMAETLYLPPIVRHPGGHEPRPVKDGLPFHETTLNSIRNYAADTSRTALDIVLTWFKNGDPGAALLQREEKAWTDQMDRIGRGMSWAEESARTEEES